MTTRTAKMGIEDVVKTAMAQVTAIEAELADLHATAARLAYDVLVGAGSAAKQRAADVDAAIVEKERERDRLRAAIEVAGVEIAKEQAAEREQAREAAEQERQRAEKVRDEHFSRIECATAQLISAFEDSVAADIAVRNAELRLGVGHGMIAGRRIGQYIGSHLQRARIWTGLPDAPGASEVLGRPLSVAGQAKEATIARRATRAEGANG